MFAVTSSSPPPLAFYATNSNDAGLEGQTSIAGGAGKRERERESDRRQKRVGGEGTRGTERACARTARLKCCRERPWRSKTAKDVAPGHWAAALCQGLSCCCWLRCTPQRRLLTSRVLVLALVLFARRTPHAPAPGWFPQGAMQIGAPTTGRASTGAGWDASEPPLLEGACARKWPTLHPPVH